PHRAVPGSLVPCPFLFRLGLRPASGRRLTRGARCPSWGRSRAIQLSQGERLSGILTRKREKAKTRNTTRNTTWDKQSRRRFLLVSWIPHQFCRSLSRFRWKGTACGTFRVEKLISQEPAGSQAR